MTVVDLTEKFARVDLAKQIKSDMDTYVLRKYNDGFRNHLGASLIGDPCTRKTYYSWHWMALPAHNGRMQRLFQRGHREEAWFCEMLTGIGFTVWLHDPLTGKQFRVSRLEGHFGGSLDAILKPPERYSIQQDMLFLGEFKTKGTGKGFNELVEKGIMLTNPQHYDQMCTYGANYGYRYSVYFTVNKNDDDLHVEIVPLDWKRAAEVERKALYIVKLKEPPPKISVNPTFWKCKGCDFFGVCHENHIPSKNCRSCTKSSPAAEAAWFCSQHNATIPDNVIRLGCASWVPIK